jgi:N-acetylneuraminic acid mutarotase
VLVAGGSGGSGGIGLSPLDSAELYDPSSGQWTATGSLRETRRDHTATLLPDGSVLVAGGSGGYYQGPLASAELYHPSSGQWTDTASMGEVRSSQTATLLPNGKVLVAGGFEDSALLGPVASAELYDPRGGRWTVVGSMAEARAWHTATVLRNEIVLVAGGYAKDRKWMASAELYEP